MLRGAGASSAQVAALQAQITALESGYSTTWAVLATMTPSSYTGQKWFVSDVGINGSFWRSNGVTWELIGGSVVLSANAVSVNVTGTTAETAFYTVTIPAGLLGANGRLLLTSKTTITGSTNAKTFRARFGNGLSGDVVATTAQTTAANVTINFFEIPVVENRNSASSQIYYLTAGVNSGSLTTAYATGAIDTTAAQSLTISGQLASSGESIKLESYILTLVR
jgi:hypothetical protein